MDFESTTTPVPPMPSEHNASPTEQLSSSAAIRVETQTYHATHNAVKAEDLSVFVGARCLLANTELKISEQLHSVQTSTLSGGSKSVQRGTCYGLVGVNGCGKSTLLRLIAEGSLPVPPNWDVFLVSQHLPQPRQHCPIEEVLTANTERMQLLCEQATLEDELAALVECDSQSFQAATTRLLELQSELSKWDGAEKEITQILLALGFRGSDQAGSHGSEPTIKTLMTELSGGWRMKIQLAKALWLQPRLLLLDEPTNHLDFEALSWLEDRLEQYPHTTVVVSHDVSFLHCVCQEILWMKDLKLESLPRDMVSQEDLLRMQRRKGLNFTFSIPQSNDAENHGLSLHGVEFSYGSSSSSRHRLQVKKEVRFSGKSRSILLGKNGSGKSTFLDLCVGKLRPTRGNIDRTPDLKIGHYSQPTEELDRNSTDTAASYLVRECPEELAMHAGGTRAIRLQKALAANSEKNSDGQASVSKRAATQQKRLLEIARGVLSNFGFEGDVAVTAPVDRLSGGQKALLKFAVLSLRPVHLLLLDEPTNHLDAEACDALAKGLSEFKGGIVAVTHDELLIYRLIHCNWSASELLICREGRVWRERDFGAHCLNALKNEVHRAEESEGQKEKQNQERGKQQSTNETKTASTTAKKELPPWLQPKRRGRDKKDEATVLDSSTAEAVAVSMMSTSADTTHVPIQQPLTPAETHQESHFPPKESSRCDAKKSLKAEHICQAGALQNSTIGVLSSWEEAAESDASTAAPEGTCMEESEELDVCSKGDREQCLVVSCMDQELGLQSCKQRNASTKAGSKEVDCKGGRHSRFAKTL